MLVPTLVSVVTGSSSHFSPYVYHSHGLRFTSACMLQPASPYLTYRTAPSTANNSAHTNASHYLLCFTMLLTQPESPYSTWSTVTSTHPQNSTVKSAARSARLAQSASGRHSRCSQHPETRVHCQHGPPRPHLLDRGGWGSIVCRYIRGSI
jgi:hypothetical protein